MVSIQNFRMFYMVYKRDYIIPPKLFPHAITPILQKVLPHGYTHFHNTHEERDGAGHSWNEKR